MKLVIATRNPGKLREIENALSGPKGLEFIPLSSFPEIPELEETGVSFAENAGRKAGFVAKATGLLTVADDSGLEVDALEGRPAVLSARFAGEHASDDENNRKLLQEMQGVPEPERTARFRCVIALADPCGGLEFVEGVCEGLILTEPRGTQGFGYDPLFYCPRLRLTFAEMDLGTKLSVSHRGKALQNLKQVLAKRLSSGPM
jgi:XTP/dITP diphosphohydrolase